MDDISEYDCMVGGRDSGGDPDFHIVKVRCTEGQINSGSHYRAAQDDARDNDFEPSFVFDEFDPAGSTVCGAFDWNDAEIIDISTDPSYEGYADSQPAIPSEDRFVDPLAAALDAVVADASRSNYDLSRLAV